VGHGATGTTTATGTTGRGSGRPIDKLTNPPAEAGFGAARTASDAARTLASTIRVRIVNLLPTLNTRPPGELRLPTGRLPVDDPRRLVGEAGQLAPLDQLEARLHAEPVVRGRREPPGEVPTVDAGRVLGPDVEHA
jgi:hypothetical protein